MLDRDRKGLEEAVLSTATDAIVAADRDGTIFFWNPGAERIFGFPTGDAVGTIIPLGGETGDLLGLAAIMRDVTGRFEEMRELKRRLADDARSR